MNTSSRALYVLTLYSHTHSAFVPCCLCYFAIILDFSFAGKEKNPDRMKSLSRSLPALLATCATSSLCSTRAYAASYSESITGYSTLGDHFGYPAFANATYDYVVVGGGTAGLTVAARLAEAGVGTVAVIEAGGFYEMDNGNLSTIPGTAAYFVGTNPGERNPLIDWEYRTESDEVRLLLTRRTFKSHMQ